MLNDWDLEDRNMTFYQYKMFSSIEVDFVELNDSESLRVIKSEQELEFLNV